MTWTTEKPTKPGWYWWRDGKYIESLTIGFVHDGPRGMVIMYSDKDELVDSVLGEWAGPLEPPKELGHE